LIEEILMKKALGHLNHQHVILLEQQERQAGELLKVLLFGAFLRVLLINTSSALQCGPFLLLGSSKKCGVASQAVVSRVCCIGENTERACLANGESTRILLETLGRAFCWRQLEELPAGDSWKSFLLETLGRAYCWKYLDAHTSGDTLKSILLETL
jgi:hypothetical protein